MIALDTNVLVRFATRDDEGQFARESEFMSSLTSANQGFLGTVVLVETWWVLSRAYEYPAAETVRYLTALLDTDELLVQEPDVIRAALRDATTGADFADAVIARTAAAAGCESTVTFDKGAADHVGMRLLG
jgi:predicted nucleic-acid-binding protein